MTPPRRRDERGVVTVTVVVLAALLVVLAVASAAGARVLVAHRQAGSAADLAALAGAVALQHGQDACSASRRLAARSAARLHSCRVSADEVRLVVAVDVGLWGRRVGVSARAHAGPR